MKNLEIMKREMMSEKKKIVNKQKCNESANSTFEANYIY